MSKIIIIDGNSLFFRAFYALYQPDPTKVMRNQDGIPTNAVFAFSNMISYLIDQLKKGDGIFVAFDKGSKTFRHKALPEYKANRPETPKDLITQLPIARELLEALNINYYECDSYEADDIAGNMAKQAETQGYKVQIYTSDKDYLQLINENITIELIKKNIKETKEMNPKTFKDEWGFEPKYIIDYKGLRGDDSDNLKGIPKVGDITAKQLISQYGDFDNILKHLDELKPAIAQSFRENENQGRLSKSLAEIKTDFDMPLTPSDTVYTGYDFEKISAFCKKYNFSMLLNKLNKDFRIKKDDASKVEYIMVEDAKTIEIPQNFGFAIDISSDNYHDATLYGFCFSFGNKNYYFSNKNNANLEYFKEILSNSSYKKYVYDYKKIKCVLAKYGIKLDGLKFDLLLASYLIDVTLKNDLSSILSYHSIDINYAYEKTMTLFEEGNPLLCAVDAYYSFKLYQNIVSKLIELNQYGLLNDIELPLADVLADMEIEGFPVNKKVLIDFGEDYKKKLDQLTSEIHQLAKQEFNINSPKELGDILYNKLKLSSQNNKKHSTSVEFLKELTEEHPIINKILEYRKYFKLLSTYVNGILPYIKDDNKLHATFNQALTQTGRLSSSEPNLQNITIKDDEAKMLRKAFFYDDEDLYILSLDYSQIELRVLAALSNAQSLIETFNADKDIHTETAKRIFNLKREPTEKERRQAKTVNFGIIYGISDWGLAEQLEIPLKAAKSIINSFNAQFPEIKYYLEKSINNAKQKGYATTLFNRRRYLPDINSSNYQVREFSKRAAMNAPIQGSAADIIKIAMIKVNEALKNKNYKSKLVNQIHDELILKVYKNEKDKVLKLVKDIMEHCVVINVNLKVDGGYAKTWFDAK